LHPLYTLILANCLQESDEFLQSARLEKASIVGRLKTRWVGHCLVVLDDCASTNDVIEKLAEDGAPHGAVVIAETQHAGRGRFGRFWCSPEGGVWLSILIRPQESLSRVRSLQLIGTIAIAKALRQGCKVDANIKWPNDVVVQGRKIAGILVESKSKGNDLVYAVLGLGINANVDTNEIELIRDSSTSLQMLKGHPIDRVELLVNTLSEVETVYESIHSTCESSVMEVLRNLDWSRGRRVRVRTADREIVGLFDDYETFDRVRVSTGSGPERVETTAVTSVDYESD